MIGSGLKTIQTNFLTCHKFWNLYSKQYISHLSALSDLYIDVRNHVSSHSFVKLNNENILRSIFNTFKIKTRIDKHVR